MRALIGKLMENIAIIKNGIVENVIAVDAETRLTTRTYMEANGYTVIDDVTCSPGDTWDGTSFSPAATEPEPEAPPKTVLTKLEYMDRFTDVELAAIYTMAKTDVNVEVWLEKFKATPEINLLDPRVTIGLEVLHTAGLLTAGRVIEILSTAPVMVPAE